MYGYSGKYQLNPISRLDDLLTKNEQIYQNLKEKLNGITRSNEQIYRNISHINSISNQCILSQEEQMRNTRREEAERKIEELQQIQRRCRAEECRENSENWDVGEVTFNEETARNINMINLKIDQVVERQRLKELESHPMKPLSFEAQNNNFAVDAKNIYLEMQIQRELELQRQLERQRQLQIQIQIQKEKQIQIQMIKEMERQREREIQRQYQKEKQYQREKQILRERQLLKSQLNLKLTNPLIVESSRPPPPKSNQIYLSPSPSNVLPSFTSSIEQEIPTFRMLQKEKTDDFLNHKLKHQQTLKSEQNLRISQQIKKMQQQNKKQAQQNNSNSFESSQKQKYTYKDEFSDYYANTNRQNEGNLGESNRQIINSNIQYSQSPSQIKIKPIINPTCILFIPFNKLYRSPILQLKQTELILSRRSKTSCLSPSRSSQRIVDGLKYKFKHIITQQAKIVKLICGEEECPHSSKGSLSQSMQHKNGMRVAVVGGKDTLKKKMHMSVLALCYQQMQRIILQDTQSFLICNIEHQQITVDSQPSISQSSIQMTAGQRKIGLMKLQKSLEDVYLSIKKTSSAISPLTPRTTNLTSFSSSSKPKILRLTKLLLFSNKEVIYSFDIVSTNRYDAQFIKCLQVDKIIWTINPLVKNWQEVSETLDSMKQYIKSK